MPHKILIANRGEIAIRIANSCKELNLPFVMVYTEEDKDSLHVSIGKEADSIFRISDYRDPNELFAVADHSGCTAVHPGYGFLAEDYRFARRAENRIKPLIFIGPNWQAVKNLGSKINTKKLARSLKIPTIPGSDEIIYDPEIAENVAEHLFDLQRDKGIDNPSVLVKASAGGGGMGIEQVTNIDAFRRTFRRVCNYAKQYFGDEGVLIEQCMVDFNHVEVQIVGDKKGNLVHYGTRNCSVQSSGRQKRIEVAQGFTSDFNYSFNYKNVLKSLVEDSIKLCNYSHYDNVGTVEWIVARNGQHYLLEVNTRIQVENDVSGKTAIIRDGKRGINLISEQIRLALGDKLGYSQNDVKFDGVSIELRIIAEDTKRNFVPQSGLIKKFSYADHEWLDVYSHVPKSNVYQIPNSYDPNLALGVVWGSTLSEAKSRASMFLEDLVLVGIDHKGFDLITNIPYLKLKLNGLLEF